MLSRIAVLAPRLSIHGDLLGHAMQINCTLQKAPRCGAVALGAKQESVVSPSRSITGYTHFRRSAALKFESTSSTTDASTLMFALDAALWHRIMSIQKRCNPWGNARCFDAPCCCDTHT